MSYLLHQLLTRTAAEQPDQLAVVFRDQHLRYRELDELSNQLARLLQAHGVRKNDRVGICLGKSLEAVVAVFGILKAGAAYVPLDPASPARRLGFIIENCGMRALVTTDQKADTLRSVLGDRSSLDCVVVTDEHSTATDGQPLEEAIVGWEALARLPSGGLTLEEEPIEDDLAYILYTSGSTGEPKGVMISHRASLTFVNWAAECFDLRPSDRVSNHAPLHFDLSTFDIFAAVKAGATMVPVPEELSVFPMNLADLIERQGITTWYSVPSVLTRLVLHADLGSRDFSALRQVLFAGEVFPTKYLRQLVAAVPHSAYFNLYGPTETNVCTFYQVRELAREGDEPIPIGRACADTEVFAVNDRSELAGTDEVGELYVRGPSLMKGYWGMPERTAEALVRNPLGLPRWDERVYRTGDLVTRAADGEYRFVGRRDSMVKSRGYRIELGEIETALYAHPEVLEAAVLAIPDDEIGNLIHAVIVSRAAGGLSAAQLQRFCGERIPKYMIPSSIEFRDALPKTSTGKVDKPALLRERVGSGR